MYKIVENSLSVTTQVRDSSDFIAVLDGYNNTYYVSRGLFSN